MKLDSSRGPVEDTGGGSGCAEGVTSQHPPAPLLFINIRGHRQVPQRSEGQATRSLEFSLQSEDGGKDTFMSNQFNDSAWHLDLADHLCDE